MNEELAIPHRKGFTLIELLVTISIIGILFGVGMAQYMRFNRRQVVLQAAEEVKSNLRLAQDKALAGEKIEDWCEDPETLAGHRLGCSGSGFAINAVCSSGAEEEVVSGSFPNEVTCAGSVLFKVLSGGAETTSFTISGFNGEFSETINVTAAGEITRAED